MPVYIPEILVIMNNTKHPFYTTMNYPIPKQKEFFAYKQKKNTEKIQKKFSRETINPHTQRLTTIVQQHEEIIKSIPFVKHIYLCD